MFRSLMKQVSVLLHACKVFKCRVKRYGVEVPVAILFPVCSCDIYKSPGMRRSLSLVAQAKSRSKIVADYRAAGNCLPYVNSNVVGGSWDSSTSRHYYVGCELMFEGSSRQTAAFNVKRESEN